MVRDARCQIVLRPRRRPRIPLSQTIPAACFLRSPFLTARAFFDQQRLKNEERGRRRRTRTIISFYCQAGSDRLADDPF
jgi:hypothetical protein